MTSARKVSSSSSVSRWCFWAPSSWRYASTSSWPESIRASSLAGIPPFTAITAKLQASPITTRNIPGIRTLMSPNETRSV
jgi:hypothetical protein